jgi:hypothetical protein
MNKILRFIKSLSKPKKKSHVTIDEFGGTHFDVSAFLHTPEGRKMLDDTHEFFERYKGKRFYD